MAGKSFYDLDYIIELNEQRLLQYTSAYQEAMGRLTTIILIYSAMAIFFVPIMRDVLWGAGNGWILKIAFLLYAVLFTISVFYTVRFIYPNRWNFMTMPKTYYDEIRIKYENQHVDRRSIENALKVAYIDELEALLMINKKAIVRKISFYQYALIFGLLSALPYLICFGFYNPNLKNFEAEIVAVARNKKL